MKINYTWIIIIIIVIFMINKNMNNDTSLLKYIFGKISELSPLKLTEDENISIITNNYNQVIDTKSFDQNKDFISPNPEGSTEFRFIDENPKTAWSTTNVSQHPKYYTSNFEDEKIDTSKFFNEQQFYHDNTSPLSKTILPDRCTKNTDNEVICNFNNKLQLIPPSLIKDPNNNLVLNSIGKLKKNGIFKTIDYSHINTVSGNTYQVWEYDGEKSINGGKYFNNIVGASELNEDYMDINSNNNKPSYSF